MDGTGDVLDGKREYLAYGNIVVFSNVAVFTCSKATSIASGREMIFYTYTNSAKYSP